MGMSHSEHDELSTSSCTNESPISSGCSRHSDVDHDHDNVHDHDHADEDPEYVLHRRFDRMGRLVGDRAMARLMSSHVMVIGLGGVGSWAAESLARSGVGRISLVDFDKVCITNSNRQLHAVHGAVGKYKSDLMAERLSKVNPAARFDSVQKFYNEETSESLFALEPDLIIDAIDNITAKCHLLATAKAKGISVICSGGASARLDPTQIKSSDLSETYKDPFLGSVRRFLRQKYGFAESGSLGIPTVFSSEETNAPHDLHYDGGKGFRCVCPMGKNNLHTCDKRRIIYGTSSFVTGSFGFALASLAVKQIIATDA